MTIGLASGVPERGKDRTPGAKLLLTLLIGFLLSIPLLAMYLLIYDRQNQSETARASIVEGWGGPQVIAGPILVIPYQVNATETVEEGGKQVTKSRTVWRELSISPEVATIDTVIKPERRQRSIYEAVVYEAHLKGQARFVLPNDLERIGVPASTLDYARAQIRFGLKDARGLFGEPPVVTIAGKASKLEPGHGLQATGSSGFFTWFDASALNGAPVTAEYDYNIRGNGSLSLSPLAGDTRWTVTSSWPSPSFQGGFLPTTRKVGADGFSATYRIGNLALGQSLVQTEGNAPEAEANRFEPRIDLVQPIDLYDQVSRAAKYGFLFIGFTFLAFLMFDIIGKVVVSAVEYLLVGVALILFFALLLAFAEVIGFTPAYVIASAAIIGLITAYSAAILKSWKRASYIGGLLTGLYAVLYILLSLEAFSLLIGSLLLFAALAGVMYTTRHLDWGGRAQVPTT
jgi:inner membrane protein